MQILWHSILCIYGVDGHHLKEYRLAATGQAALHCPEFTKIDVLNIEEKT